MRPVREQANSIPRPSLPPVADDGDDEKSGRSRAFIEVVDACSTMRCLIAAGEANEYASAETATATSPSAPRSHRCQTVYRVHSHIVQGRFNAAECRRGSMEASRSGAPAAGAAHLRRSHPAGRAARAAAAAGHAGAHQRLRIREGWRLAAPRSPLPQLLRTSATAMPSATIPASRIRTTTGKDRPGMTAPTSS